MSAPPLPREASGNAEMWHYVETLRALLGSDHEEQGEIAANGKWRDFRFYMVGKLIRQDLKGKDEGYRETLYCPCHPHSLPRQYVKVFGPLRTRPRYSAHCAIDSEQIAEADTMEELWSAVENKREIGASGVGPVTAAVQEQLPIS